MALKQLNLTVGTTPTLLVTMPSGTAYTSVTICNNHNQPIYLGNANVGILNAATAGTALAAGATVQVWLRSNDSLYAISALATTANSISVLYSGL